MQRTIAENNAKHRGHLDAPETEAPLHNEIAAWCNAQWPKWKFIHARMDRKATIGEGVHDFTIYAPAGRVLNIECKSRTGKLSEEQRDWSHELERNGHAVHVVRTMAEFLQLTNQTA